MEHPCNPCEKKIDMFSKETYTNRRNVLKGLVNDGLLVFLSGNECPNNYPANVYYPFRPDSSFLYYFGIIRDGLAGVIDVESGDMALYGDDVDVADIVWTGPVETLASQAEKVGISKTGTFQKFIDLMKDAHAKGRKIHFLPPYRHQEKLLIQDVLGIHHTEQTKAASVELIKAVVKMRAVKEEQEITEIEKACEIGYKMHTAAMRSCRPGVTEKFVGGIVAGEAMKHGWQVSFPVIFSQHGEVMHGGPQFTPLLDGRLALCDAGAENEEFYCSDHTRTFPVNGKFTQQQREIYSVVEQCHDYVLDVAKAGIKWRDVHVEVCRMMTDRLKEIGLMKGDTDEAVACGAHAMFMPHGLGHMMGMDVHDMENLGQKYVGFKDDEVPSDQFGICYLRCSREVEEGFVMTDEPGIYFIPALIDDWKSKRKFENFINYDMLEKYRDFGGIRIEDDILILKDGCRFLGKSRIPYHPDDVEEFMSSH